MPGRASCADRWGRPPSSSWCWRDCLHFILHGQKLETAHELAEQLLRLAQSVQFDVFLRSTHHVVGATLYVMGDLIAARKHLEQSFALYDPQQYRSYGF